MGAALAVCGAVRAHPALAMAHRVQAHLLRQIRCTNASTGGQATYLPTLSFVSFLCKPRASESTVETRSVRRIFLCLLASLPVPLGGIQLCYKARGRLRQAKIDTHCDSVLRTGVKAWPYQRCSSQAVKLKD